MKSKHGGARRGAGRPPGEPTTVLRLTFLDETIALIRKYAPAAKPQDTIRGIVERTMRRWRS